ncbi:DUF2235 domain-containing protein [Methylobacterium sp. E-025]|uniref:DUF2235 domain-containing protein n=1 Tax=Methylobacterium sp. E-025 TaxID=2836561 RepID=UPI001FB9107F|nr:DUF2235 domain-containing protein [Methylobacterium sp. E-025]MCJ2110267.1 DUF2235 domain-containing protein [Methylobacterium sp. E-025]
MKKLIVFADGTGNAFMTQESNVWRLFQALDQGGPDQLARYIPGVGTSGFKPFAVLDGATGLGVPSNVRKLYRFICWNWRPGDEIWMFGFSRGAFTIRTLAALIASQGLVPARIGTSPVSRVEMDRNAMAAWRAYRTRTAPAGWTRPTIAVARAIRDFGLALHHGLLGHRSYSAVRAEMDRQRLVAATLEDPSENRVEVGIEFLGLFDTVEAFGVPLEEMRRAVDRMIWPISFRNRELAKNVRHVRHALALDDERTSFHPVLFDMRHEPDRRRIREVWFAGVHSDVGGGYPDPSLALVPLLWMLDEIHVLPNNGLTFSKSAVAGFKADASSFGPRHDSRSGPAVAYRYSPREIRIDGSRGGPVVHNSVLEKMVLGSDLYAPATLPDDARVWVPPSMAPNAAECILRIGDSAITAAVPNLAPPARMPQPVPGYIELVRDAVWWRRVAYFLMIAAVGIVASLPWTAGPLADGFERSIRAFLRPFGAATWWDDRRRDWMGAENALSGNLDLVAPTIGTFIPGFARSYLDALVAHPLPCLAVLLATWLLYLCSCRLRDRIADLARCAWFASSGLPQAPAKQPPYFRRSGAASPGGAVRPSIPSRIARAVRNSTTSEFVHRSIVGVIAPSFFVALIGLTILVVVSRITVTTRSAAGTYCSPGSILPSSLAEGETRQARGPLAIDQICSPTGIRLERGSRYQIQLTMTDPWFDRDVISGTAGFAGSTLPYVLALPLRRNPEADWLQPIARIGLRDATEFALKFDGGAEAGLPAWNGVDSRGDVQSWNGRRLPASIRGSDAPVEPARARGCRLDLRSLSDKLPSSMLAKAEDFHAKLQRLPTTYLSEFVAKADGELFLFVNDAIVGVPYFDTCHWFYDNNRGSAVVRVKKLEVPRLPDGLGR